MDRRLGIAALASVALLLSCGSEPTGPRAADIVVSPASVTLPQQGTQQLSVSVIDADGILLSGVGVTFASADQQLVTVSNLGLVTSVGPAGSTHLVLRAAGLEKQVPVTVSPVSTRISVTPNPGVVAQKGTLQLQAQLLDLTDTPVPGAVLAFASGNTTIATVSAGGLVTSVGPAGQVTIAVTSGQVVGQAVIAVTQVPSELVVPLVITIGRGRSLQMGVSVLDAVGTAIPDAVVGYAAGPANLLTITSAGFLTAADALGDGSVTVRSGSLETTVTVHVVDATHPQGTIVGTTTVADGFSTFGVAISPSGRIATGGLSGAVSVGALPSFALASTDHDGQITAVAFGPDDRLYASGVPYDGVSEIDPDDGHVVRSLSGLVGTPFDLVVSPDGQTIYLGTGDGRVYFIDVPSFTVRHELTVGGAFVHLALHPTQPKLYASPQSGPAIIEIDTGTREQRPLPTSAGAPQAVAVSLDGTELYVANEWGTVEVLTIASAETAASIPLECGGYGMARTPDGVQLYVTCSQSGVIKIIDPATRAVIGTLPASGIPRRAAVSPDGSTVAVANEGNTVDFIQ